MDKQGNSRFTAADCTTAGGMALSHKVIVIRPEALPENHPSQLFFCMDSFGAKAGPAGRVYAVSLANGERCLINRCSVIGALKPELLPDEARLYLSQIRPDRSCHALEFGYCGYCFLEDGRYSSGVQLKDAQDAVTFMETQGLYQHRVLICDGQDTTVAEMVRGELVFPTQKEMEIFRQTGRQEGTGGMRMT
jgi:hypothetical protein